jgi:hypothetical protein
MGDDFAKGDPHSRQALLIALDGTEYHCSRKIHCPHCSTRFRA